MFDLVNFLLQHPLVESMIRTVHRCNYQMHLFPFCCIETLCFRSWLRLCNKWDGQFRPQKQVKRKRCFVKVSECWHSVNSCAMHFSGDLWFWIQQGEREREQERERPYLASTHRKLLLTFRSSLPKKWKLLCKLKSHKSYEWLQSVCTWQTCAYRERERVTERGEERRQRHWVRAYNKDTSISV